MNMATRKTIHALVAEIEVIDVNHLIEQVTDLQGDEQEKFDNLSEGLQASERGLAIEAAADALSEALDLLAEISDSLEQAVEALQRAAE